MKQRINWIDTSRGLAFLMVIYYHLATRSIGDGHLFFTPVFLTTFFLVSGYLTKSGLSFAKVLEQRTRTLLVPLIIFGFGGGILLNIKYLLAGDFLTFILEPLKDVFIQKDEHQTLWFVATLYVYSLVFYWIDRWCKAGKQLLIVCLCLFVLNALYNTLDGTILNYRINSVGFGCFYMGLGKLYRRYEAKVDDVLNRKVVVLCVVVYFSYIAFVFPGVNFSGGRFFSMEALLLTITGLIWMIWQSKHITVNSKWLQFIGANTLLYFSMHRQVLHGVEAITQKIMTIMEWEPSILINLVETALIALLLMIPTWIINNYIPQITGKGWKLWECK